MASFQRGELASQANPGLCNPGQPFESINTSKTNSTWPMRSPCFALSFQVFRLGIIKASFKSHPPGSASRGWAGKSLQAWRSLERRCFSFHSSWAVSWRDVCTSPMNRFRRRWVSFSVGNMSENVAAWQRSTNRATSSEERQSRCSRSRWVTFTAGLRMTQFSGKAPFEPNARPPLPSAIR